MTLGNLALVENVEIHGLFETEQMFRSIIAVQGAGDNLLAVLATLITQAGKDEWIALTSQNGFDDLHSGLSGDVGNHIGKLQIHLGQGLLHLLDMRGSIANQIHPLPNIAAQSTYLFGRTKGTFQKAVGVEPLQPLAIQDIAFKCLSINNHDLV